MVIMGANMLSWLCKESSNQISHKKLTLMLKRTAYRSCDGADRKIGKHVFEAMSSKLAGAGAGIAVKFQSMR